MGNQIAVDIQPASIEEFSGGNQLEQQTELNSVVQDYSHYDQQEPIFNSILHVWQIQPDLKDDLFVHNTPVEFKNFSGFEDERSYIVLHIYLSQKQLETTKNIEKKESKPASTVDTGEAVQGEEFSSSHINLSVVQVVVSANQQLSPKGQANAFGGLHSIVNTFHNNESTKRGKVFYDMYVWYGKEAVQIVRANSLAKAFDLDGMLKKRNLDEFLPLFYQPNSRLVSLSKLLQFDHSLSVEEWKRQINANQLFTLIYQNQVDGIGCDSPLITKKSKRSSKKSSSAKNMSTVSRSEPNTPQTDPKSRPRIKKRRRSRPGTSKTPLADTKDVVVEVEIEEKIEKIEKPAPQVSAPAVVEKETRVVKPVSAAVNRNRKALAHKKLKEGLTFRSMSMPSEEIARVRKTVKLDISFASDTESLKIDLTNVGQQAQHLSPPPEGKVKKIARYDKICSKITDSLYLGSDTIARSERRLKKYGITHVLNCAGTICENYFPGKFTYKKLYLCDGTKENIDSLFYEVLEFMDDAMENGGKVFVHCHQGISRSSAMTILYLMWKDNSEYQSTHERVKAIREVANPNAGFTCQLLNWWSSRTSKASFTRMYAVLPHCLKAPDMFILREVSSKDHFTHDLLDPRGCFLVWTQNRVFVWVGSKCSPYLSNSGMAYATRLMRFEHVAGFQEEVQGKESPEFIQLFGQANAELLVGETSDYDDSYSLLDYIGKTSE